MAVIEAYVGGCSGGSGGGEGKQGAGVAFPVLVMSLAEKKDIGDWPWQGCRWRLATAGVLTAVKVEKLKRLQWRWGIGGRRIRDGAATGVEEEC